MTHSTDTDYSLVYYKDDGTVEELDDWISYEQASRVLKKVAEARRNVVNSPVTAIEIVNSNKERVTIVRF